jgi:hydroxymethylpyrimidine pyrophosphatase-like HAD family hydrolase
MTKEVIEYFVSDVDGCLATPFQEPDWEALSVLRKYHQRARHDRKTKGHSPYPLLSICTGRPLAYTEALTQWLGIRTSFVFESALVFDLESYQVTGAATHRDAWIQTDISSVHSIDPRDDYELDNFSSLSQHPGVRDIHQVKEWFLQDVVLRYPEMSIEFAKILDAGLVCHNPELVDIVEKETEQYLKHQNLNHLEVHTTDVSINVLLGGNNKGLGLRLLANAFQTPLSQIAYIGDSSGDIPALDLVGRPFTPANARTIVRQQEGYHHLASQTTASVLEAYELCVKDNMG